MADWHFPSVSSKQSLVLVIVLSPDIIKTQFCHDSKCKHDITRTYAGEIIEINQILGPLLSS